MARSRVLHLGERGGAARAREGGGAPSELVVLGDETAAMGDVELSRRAARPRPRRHPGRQLEKKALDARVVNARWQSRNWAPAVFGHRGGFR